MRIRAAYISIIMVAFVLSGSLAYSSFQGKMTTNITSSAYFTEFGEQISVVAFWANNTEIYVNGNALISHSGCLFNDLDPQLVVVEKKTSYSGQLTESLNISHIGPGNAVLFCLNIYNLNNQECLISNLSFGPFYGPGLTEFTGSSYDNQSEWFNVVNSTLATQENEGGFQGFVIEPQDYIPPGGTLSVALFIMLSIVSGNPYQEAFFTIPVDVNLVIQ
ncbi:MAG: hypothetical protein QXV22_03875 [Thermoplasmataceae archaeon]